MTSSRTWRWYLVDTCHVSSSSSYSSSRFYTELSYTWNSFKYEEVLRRNVTSHTHILFTYPPLRLFRWISRWTPHRDLFDRSIRNCKPSIHSDSFPPLLSENDDRVGSSLFSYTSIIHFSTFYSRHGRNGCKKWKRRIRSGRCEEKSSETINWLSFFLLYFAVCLLSHEGTIAPFHLLSSAVCWAFIVKVLCLYCHYSLLFPCRFPFFFVPSLLFHLSPSHRSQFLPPIRSADPHSLILNPPRNSAAEKNLITQQLLSLTTYTTTIRPLLLSPVHSIHSPFTQLLHLPPQMSSITFNFSLLSYTMILNKNCLIVFFSLPHFIFYCRPCISRSRQREELYCVTDEGNDRHENLWRYKREETGYITHLYILCYFSSSVPSF